MILPIISPEISSIINNYHAGIIEAIVSNQPTSSQLSEEIRSCSSWLQENFTTDSIKERSSIAATRAAYKAARKDPSRYRPSCEQLARRVLQGKDLYSISMLVDLGNLISLQSGYSVAVLDAAHIKGNTITFGIGRGGEDYEGIGRGPLNIAHLPVWRDELGSFATPTSDSVRTQCELTTEKILIIINGFDGDVKHLTETMVYTEKLLLHFCEAEEIHSAIYP